MDLRNLKFNVKFDGSTPAVTQMDGATSKLKETSKGAIINLEKMEKSFSKAGKSLMKKVTTPLVGFGAASIKTVSTFDDSMSQVKAISGATVNELEEMRDMAKNLGATTAHSASDAADGMTILAASGQKTNEILETTPHLLSLASAASIDLESSASILTGTLAQFGLKSTDGQMVTDVFAKAASSANTNVAELGEAMKYAGGEAANMGMDIQQTNAVLGVFANANLRGSMAGTTFSAMFKDLTSKAEGGAVQIGKTSVAVYDAAGNIRDMGSVMTDVEKATKGMTDAQRDAALQSVFQGQSMRGVNAFLSQGAEKYKELEGAIYDSNGAAAQMAADMEDNIGGAFRGLKSATEGLMIEVGDVFKDDVKQWADALTGLAGKFGQLDEGTQRTIVKMGGLAAATGPVLFGISKVAGTVNKLSEMFGILSIAKMKDIAETAILKGMYMRDTIAKVANAVATKGMTAATTIWNATATAATGITTALGTAINFMTGPIGLTILGITGLVAAGVVLYKNWDAVKEKAASAWGATTKVVEGAVGKIKGFWQGLEDFMKNPIKGTVNIFRRDKGAKANVDGSHASGLGRVPFDGYLAELHKGEEVLTAGDPRNINNYKTSNNDNKNYVVHETFSPQIIVNIDGSASVKEQLPNIEKEVERVFYPLLEQYWAQMRMKRPSTAKA